jgi:hypothetical protein
LNFFRTSKGKIRVVTATRDAPYARGTINIFDGQGNRVVPELTGFDVCNNRPAFLDVNKDGELDVLTGSHGFYGAKYANSLTAIDSITGNIIWSTLTEVDTGSVNFPILDIDGDGEKEIMIPMMARSGGSDPKNSNYSIYSQEGQQKGEIKGVGMYQADFPNSDGDFSLLYTDSNDLGPSDQNLKGKVFFQNMKTREISYELPLIAFNIVSILDLDADNIPEILVTLKIDNVLSLLLLNAYTGQLKSVFQLNSKEEVRSKYQEGELANLFNEKVKEDLPENLKVAFLQSLDSIDLLKGLFNFSLPESFRDTMQKLLQKRVSQGIKSAVLVDVDGDGFWEMLGMENSFNKVTTMSNVEVSDAEKGYHTAYDLPFPVLKGYDTRNLDTSFGANLFKSKIS